MNKFVTFVKLPHPPEWFITMARDEIVNNKQNSPEYYKLSPITSGCEPAETVEINGRNFNYGEFYTHTLSDKLKEWCRRSLPLNISPGGILVTKGDLWPHQDYKYAWSLNYLIDSGGINVETYWSQEEGSDLRPEFRGLPYWRNNTKLKEVYSYKIPERQWVLLPVNIVHGTKNQTSDRVALSAKLTNTEYKLLLRLQYEPTH